MVRASRAKLLVRNTRRLPVCGSLNLIRRSGRLKALTRIIAGQDDGLVADQAGCALKRTRVAAARLQVGPDLNSGFKAETAYHASGTVEDGRDAVARRFVGSSRLVFSVSAAFAPPLLTLASEENGGFHFVGS